MTEQPVRKINKLKSKYFVFFAPICVLISIIIYLAFRNIEVYWNLAFSAVIFGICIGCIQLINETIQLLKSKKFVIDYIAILAIAVSIISGEYFVCSIIVLMLSGGYALEEYARNKAKLSLTELTERIPHEVLIWENGKTDLKIPVGSVKLGQYIYIRKGEVIPLDGILISDKASTDESSLTGEPYILDKLKGDTLRSGTVNCGQAIVVKVTKTDKNSTYRQIINLVKSAQLEKTNFVRLADKYSTIFTIMTLALATITYLITGDKNLILAILVIATPCPLILATPVALIGGMNASAKKRIILKNLSSLEVLSRVDTLVFDKTGTITLGTPKISEVKIYDKRKNIKEVYAIAAAIERSSLHPIAKAIVEQAIKQNAPRILAKDIKEVIGSHIEGNVNGKNYMVSKPMLESGTYVQLKQGKTLVAEFYFEELLKVDSKEIIKKLKDNGLDIYIFTGDKKEAAEAVARQLGGSVKVNANYTPQDKLEGIKAMKQSGKTVAMIGDGINDAPALAISDVGMVFSNEEHTAASDAADVVFIGGDFVAVSDSLNISSKTIRIAKQSIFVGIGLSTIGMFLAAFGFIAPVTGAFIQEAIDVAVIFNALRASR